MILFQVVLIEKLRIIPPDLLQVVLAVEHFLLRGVMVGAADIVRQEHRDEPGLFKMTVYDSTGRGGHFTDSQPASLFFPENDAKYCKNSCEFRENSAKDCELQQLSAISRNSSKIP